MALDYQIAQLLNSLLWECLAPCSLHTTVYKRQSQDGKRYSSSTTTLRGTIAFSFRLFSFNLGVCCKPKKMRFQLEQENRSPQTPNPISKVNGHETGLRIQEFHSIKHKLVGDFLPRSMQVDASFSKGCFFQVPQYTQTLNLFVLYSESLRPPEQGPESKFPLSQTLCVYTTFITQCLETNLVIYQVSCSFTRYQTYCAKCVAIKYVNQTTICYKTYFHLPAFWPNPLPPPKKKRRPATCFSIVCFPKIESQK